MMKRFFSILALCTVVASMYATIVQTVNLKGGSELKGYISAQIPGKNFVFFSEEATICLPDSLVKSVLPQTYAYADLDQKWKDWGEANDAFIGKGDDRRLELYDVVTANETIGRVRVLAQGKEVKYLDLVARQHQLAWDSVMTIKIAPREKTALSGINRIYTLKGGNVVEGQYVEETVGKNISVLPSNGMIQSFTPTDVAKCTFVGVNPNQDLISQSPLIDIIKKNDGTEVRGLIVERNYESEKGDFFMQVRHEDNSVETVKYKDVMEFRMLENSSYSPQNDIVVSVNAYYLNRDSVNTITLKENADSTCIRLDSIPSKHFSIEGGKELVLEYNADDSLFEGQPVIVPLVETKVKKKFYYQVTYKDLAVSSIKPTGESEVSVNNTKKLKYVLTNKGYYLIPGLKQKKAIFIEVK